MQQNSLKTLFIKIIQFNESKGINYYLIRNYEKYPNEFTGDIDIYIDLAHLKEHQTEFEEIFEKNGWIVFHKLYRNWIYSYQLVLNEKSESRRIIVIEFFNNFSWLEYEYISSRLFDNTKIRYNGFNALPSNIGYFITFLHYFYWAGFLPEKYRYKIDEFLKDDDVKRIINKTWPENLRRLIQNELNHYLAGNKFVKIDSIPEQIYLFSRFSRLIHKAYLLFSDLTQKPFKSITKLAYILSMYLREVSNPRGKIILFYGSKENAYKLLYFLKKFHLFKNKNSGIIEKSLGKHLIHDVITYLSLYLRIARGSILIIPCLSAEKPPKINFSKLVLHFCASSNYEPDLNDVIDQLISK